MDIATWKHTSAGPVLYVCGVEVRDWLGVAHDAVCERFCKAIKYGCRCGLCVQGQRQYWRDYRRAHAQSDRSADGA